MVNNRNKNDRNQKHGGRQAQGKDNDESERR
jgi:hypothetical protein